MASQVKQERYKNAVIDCSDMTLTEYDKDEARTYNLNEILARWDGVANIMLSIQQREELPQS